MPTHTVQNQPPPLSDWDVFGSDAALVEAVRREGGDWGEAALGAWGKVVGSQRTIELGIQANRNPPTLCTHDRFGHRRDEVEFHPAWHELLRLTMQQGGHSGPWRDPRPGAHVVRAAAMYLVMQAEAGHTCPISMTYASVPSLRHTPELAAEWEPKIGGTEYDPRLVPMRDKSAVLLGMAMTEKQGGTDVRANTTRADPAPGEGGFVLTGHKWFCSAPMCDAFLVLGQAPRGLSCFLVPRVLPDGRKNAFFLQRLKDKLGNRSNASSEIELDGAWGRLVGEEGRGVATIMEMANHTRLDCVVGSAGLLRQATAQALHHARHRAVFGRRLLEQPLMRNVLADLALESEAATALAMRLARGYDRQRETESEAAFRRIATAVAKFWVCKRAVAGVAEAMECLGGNGYVEESVLPRLYRETPVNSIWEGSGNVICLDVMRAAVREPRSYDAFVDEVRLARGGDGRLDAFLEALPAPADLRDETRGRRLVERLALALEGALLVRHAPAAVADAFCQSRLAGDAGASFGTLPAGVGFDAILERGTPVVAA
jgi:putative acyl-CoA dehydrogenase